MPDHQSQGFFTSEDGTPIFYEVKGTGRPLIFCYGLVCRREHWRHQLAFFESRYQVITLDYRGHHASGLPANDRHLTLEWCARDVKGLIRHLDLKEAVCLGHSMGVAVATILGAIEPERIRGLVLICGSVSNPFQNMFFSDRMDRFYRWSSMLYDMAPSMVSQIWRRFTASNRMNFFLTSQLGFNPRLAEAHDVRGYMDGVNVTPFKVFHSLMTDYTRFDGREGLKSIACPSLVVAGAEDFITPIYLQEEMARLLPKGVLEKVPMGSHNAHTDLPDMVNQKIENFLNQIEYS